MSNEKAIHSSYNPTREAEKYIDSLSLNADISYFILLECGLGYMIPVLRKKNPNAKIISLHICDLFKNNALVADAEWSPSSNIECYNFLEKHIPDIESNKIKIIEWRPSIELDAKKYVYVLKEAASFIRIADANKRTAAHFEKRWERNVARNILLLKQNISCDLGGYSIIICASGPSLEKSIESIKEIKNRESCKIIAVASSVESLAMNGVLPDIIITSDGGVWASFHLHSIVRIFGKSTNKPIIVAALNSCLLSDFISFPVFFFSDGSNEQNNVFKSCNAAQYVLPSRGTVTANAIDFAMQVSRCKIYVSGLDLQNSDIRSHSRPYTFDIFLWRYSNRLQPYYNLQYKRSKAVEGGGSYKIYKDWFEKNSTRYEDRINFLRAS